LRHVELRRSRVPSVTWESTSQDERATLVATLGSISPARSATPAELAILA
jgi:hypothetical protein